MCLPERQARGDQRMRGCRIHQQEEVFEIVPYLFDKLLLILSKSVYRLLIYPISKFYIYVFSIYV